MLNRLGRFVTLPNRYPLTIVREIITAGKHSGANIIDTHAYRLGRFVTLPNRHPLTIVWEIITAGKHNGANIIDTHLVQSRLWCLTSPIDT